MLQVIGGIGYERRRNKMTQATPEEMADAINTKYPIAKYGDIIFYVCMLAYIVYAGVEIDGWFSYVSILVFVLMCLSILGAVQKLK